VVAVAVGVGVVVVVAVVVAVGVAVGVGVGVVVVVAVGVGVGVAVAVGVGVGVVMTDRLDEIRRLAREYDGFYGPYDEGTLHKMGTEALELLAWAAGEIERLRGALRVVGGSHWWTVLREWDGTYRCCECDAEVTFSRDGDAACTHADDCPVPSALAVMEGLP
jgi:hypothetical protein